MNKPAHGDEVILRYEGQTVRATCNDVTELPARGAGLARFTIVSKTPFLKGSTAVLTRGVSELTVNVERVTMMRHKGINIVSFLGLFEESGARQLSTQPAGI